MGMYAVTCFTCMRKLLESDNAPEDGQAVLTAFAEYRCQVTGCPHTNAALAAAKKIKDKL